MRGTAQNELFAAIFVGGLLGVFTSLLFTLPVLQPRSLVPAQQDYGR